MPAPASGRLRVASILLTWVAFAGCVSIRNVDDEQLPAAWREGIASVTAFRDPSGRYQSGGDAVSSKGDVAAARLVDVFFPGVFGRRQSIDLVDLSFDPQGRISAKAMRGGSVLKEITFDATRDPKSGWLEVSSIPVEDTNKFGKVASTQSARLALAADRKLYVKVRTSGAGVVLFLPAVGTRSAWGRWESAPNGTAR